MRRRRIREPKVEDPPRTGSKLSVEGALEVLMRKSSLRMMKTQPPLSKTQVRSFYREGVITKSWTLTKIILLMTNIPICQIQGLGFNPRASPQLLEEFQGPGLLWKGPP